MEHFVDLDQENATAWSPSPETNLEKRRHPRGPRASGASARRRRGADGGADCGAGRGAG